MENEKLPDSIRLKELLKRTDEKLLEVSQELDYDNNAILTLAKFYETMKKVFVKKKLRKAIKQSETYQDLEYNCRKAAHSNKGYNCPTNEMKVQFEEYRSSYITCFLELVRDEIRK